MVNKLRIGVIGGGNMGAAILAGICEDYQVSVCEEDPSRRKTLKRKFRVPVVDLKELCLNSDVIILAVKPQGFDPLLAAIKPFVRKRHVVVSIAAGITTTYIEKRLPDEARVIRTMPNLPAQVKKGVTGISAGRYATLRDTARIRRIFQSVGSAFVLDEKLIDAVTAVSGSGPAYVFLFIESWLAAAAGLGLEKHMSREMILDTIKGAIKLLEESGEDASQLRERVTSKGGTTAAALNQFAKHKIGQTFKDALKSARDRAKELSR